MSILKKPFSAELGTMSAIRKTRFSKTNNSRSIIITRSCRKGTLDQNVFILQCNMPKSGFEKNKV